MTETIEQEPPSAHLMNTRLLPVILYSAETVLLREYPRDLSVLDPIDWIEEFSIVDVVGKTKKRLLCNRLPWILFAEWARFEDGKYSLITLGTRRLSEPSNPRNVNVCVCTQ